MLTRESILAMEPGRELDRIIADKVTNYVSMTTAWNPIDNMYGDLPHYSTDISAAWKVFELNGIIGHVGYQGEEYICTIWSHWDDKGYGVNAQAAAENAPLAICRAALLTTIREDTVDV